MEFLSSPWPWYVAGPLIVVVMFLLLFLGERFGISSSYRTVCNIAGGGKISDHFRYDWKRESWLLLFVLGSILGGFIASEFIPNIGPIDLNPSTVKHLEGWGIKDAGSTYLPSEIFSWESLGTLPGFIMMVIGGFLVGFGTRYAGGCTSGHAISGLSNLQLPSLIAVIGFFIGGLLMTHILLPIILAL
jgi:uncharacterized membrane protein YedE/YeeE